MEKNRIREIISLVLESEKKDINEVGGFDDDSTKNIYESNLLSNLIKIYHVYANATTRLIDTQKNMVNNKEMMDLNKPIEKIFDGINDLHNFILAKHSELSKKSSE